MGGDETNERHRRQVMMTADEANDATGRGNCLTRVALERVTKVIH